MYQYIYKHIDIYSEQTLGLLAPIIHLSGSLTFPLY